VFGAFMAERLSHEDSHPRMWFYQQGIKTPVLLEVPMCINGHFKSRHVMCMSLNKTGHFLINTLKSNSSWL
jgi:hypothetical protein